MSNLLELQTILEFQQRNEKAFELVFNAYYKLVCYFTYKLTDNREEAEDITLGVFSELFKRCNLFETETNIKAFLYISARNRSFNYLQAKKRMDDRNRQAAQLLQDDTLLEYEYSIRTELVAIVYKAAMELPAECKNVFKLLFLEGLTPAEVAARLQISINTVYVQKSRAVNTLRMKLTDSPLILILGYIFWYC